RKKAFGFGGDFVRVYIADDQHYRIIGRERGVMKVDERLPRHRVQRLRRWRDSRVRMLAKHHFRDTFRREEVWRRALLNQHLLRILAREINFVLWKRWLESYVGHQLENFIHVD